MLRTVLLTYGLLVMTAFGVATWQHPGGWQPEGWVVGAVVGVGVVWVDVLLRRGRPRGITAPLIRAEQPIRPRVTTQPYGCQWELTDEAHARLAAVVRHDPRTSGLARQIEENSPRRPWDDPDP